jgi:hypothetical protein
MKLYFFGALTIFAILVEILTRYRYEVMLALLSSENVYVQSALMYVGRLAATTNFVKYRVHFDNSFNTVLSTLNATDPIDDTLGIRTYEQIVLPGRDGRGWFKMLLFAPPNPQQ